MTNDKHEENDGVEGNTSTNAARNIINEPVHTSREKGESMIIERELMTSGKTSTEKRNRRESMKAEDWYIDIFIAKKLWMDGECAIGS